MVRFTRWLAAAAVLAGAVAIPGAAQTSKGQAGTDIAIFAAGCFWCVEEAFDKVPGVVSTTSGYTAGRTRNPSYEDVSSGGTGHTEALQVVYDPTTVSYEALLATFWRNVDAVDAGGQFCDRGSQYRSGIYARSPEQQRLAEVSRAKVATQLGKPIATEIVSASEFYPAEGYHQDYYTKNPVRYKFYKWNCGRAQRLAALWGESPVKR